MKPKEYLITPEDLLFFRDARPMAAGEGYGYGCNMPKPDQLHKALRTALLHAKGQLPASKSPANHTSDREKHKKGRRKRIGSDTFGSLRTVGPFPYLPETGVLFALPRDVIAIDVAEKSLSKTHLEKTDSPRPGAEWRPKALPLAGRPPTKQRFSGCWTASQVKAYLAGRQTDFTPIPPNTVWEEEWRVGVEIDPATYSSREGQLYAAAHMRMTDGAGFAVGVSLHEADDLAALKSIQFGGEQRLARLQPMQALLPDIPPPTVPDSGPACIVKWILLTPAVFAHGTVPGWCMDSREPAKLPPGRVCLPVNGRAELAACAVGDPDPFSGWDFLDGQAKPSLYAVRPGAVYYFWCESPAVAAALCRKIHWQPRSDMLSEAGYGYGVCTVEPTDMNLNPQGE